jgi:hypothetical protein
VGLHSLYAFGKAFPDFDLTMKACRPAVWIISAVYYIACGMVFIVGKKVLSLRYIAYMHFAKS